MPKSEDERYDLSNLPQSIQNRGQFTVTVGSSARKRKILKLMELTGTRVLSRATWIAIDHYLKAHGALEEEEEET